MADMDKIIYLAKVDQILTSKNKLQAEIIKFLVQYDRQTIFACDINEYMKTIKRAIEVLNKKYFRCTPVEVEWWAPAAGSKELKDWHLSLGGLSLIYFRLYAGRII
jgi:hypothetical protein